MTNDTRLDDVAEAVGLLAGALGELAILLTDDPSCREQAFAARRLAGAAERISERLLLSV